VHRPLLLLVDDEPGILDVVSQSAARAGFDVVACAGERDAIAQMQTRRADLLMVDLRMPDVGGLDVLRAIRNADPHCQTVLMTGYADVETAVEAVKLGARDYLIKPLDVDRLEQMLFGVREEADRRRSVVSLESDLARRLEFAGMIGRGPLMQELFEMIRRLAPHVRTALVTGETGTGKELVARALHMNGSRRQRPFVTVSCSGGAEAQLEGELFGHDPGAFTAATEGQPGVFELADGGTLFLDGIGDLPLDLQVRLLRVLEVGEVHRFGSLDARRVDVHVIAATDRDLRAEVAAGRFRTDLYYRLTIVEIRVPPLRDRREDIPYLTASFVREASERHRKPLLGLTPGAERLLTAASWDGNVRELHSVIERACVVCDGELITVRELAGCMPAALSAPPVLATDPRSAHPQPAVADADLLISVEREHIQRALIRAGGNKKAAAKILGLSRRALYRRLERLDLAGTISRRRSAPLVQL
jgi:DNA-binding NtrC family response regulator